jgi:hypothetical protein
MKTKKHIELEKIYKKKIDLKFVVFYIADLRDKGLYWSDSIGKFCTIPED